MAKKPKDKAPTEWELLLVAGEFLTREFQDDSRFIRVDYWKECGECGLWLCTSEVIEDLPEEFMDFELDQKVIQDG